MRPKWLDNPFIQDIGESVALAAVGLLVVACVLGFFELIRIFFTGKP